MPVIPPALASMLQITDTISLQANWFIFLTPTEAYQALEAGADFLKCFPAATFKNIRVYEEENIDFSTATITPYADGSQDITGTVTVVDSSTVNITGNSWKKNCFPDNNY